MAGLVKAPLVTDAMPPTGARDGGWRAGLRTTPGRLRAGVALVVLLACGLGLLTGMVSAAIDSGFTSIGGHDAPLVEQSNPLYYAVSDMDAQVGNVLLTGSDPALAADQQQDLALYAGDEQHAEQDLQQVAVTAAADPAAQRAVSSVLDALGRYLVNPALAAATLLAVGLAIAGAVQLGVQAGNLKVAKQDAFDSILALTQARAVSYDANADETRFLVDPGRAAAYQDAFLRKSQELVSVGNVGIFSYDAALAADVRAYQADNTDVRFGGYLGTEFRNITFTGERAAATRALLAYQVYEKDDRKLRAMAKTNLAQAIAFDIGTGPGQSDWAFNQWDGALGSVITINENAFTAAIRDGHTTGSPWIALIPAIGTALIAALAIAGTRPRLAEYR